MSEPKDIRPEDRFTHREALRNAWVEGPSDAARARMWRNVESRLGAPEPRRLAPLVPALASLLVLAVALSAIYLLARSRLFPPTHAPRFTGVPDAGPGPVFVWKDDLGSTIEPGTTAEVPKGAKKSLRLGRRATAALEEGSVVEIPKDGPSVVVKSGAVAFEVQKDPAAPQFIVGAAGVTVTVVGTAFRVFVHESDVSVDVSRGAVRVSTASETVLLSAGEAWSQVRDPEKPPHEKKPEPEDVRKAASKEGKANGPRDEVERPASEKPGRRGREDGQTDETERPREQRKDPERGGGRDPGSDEKKEKKADPPDHRRPDERTDRRGKPDERPDKPTGKPADVDKGQRDERREDRREADRDRRETKEEKAKEEKEKDKKHKKPKDPRDRKHRKHKPDPDRK